MPSYKLQYFNIGGLGEPIRLIMSYGGVDFEDVRYSFEEWPQHKSKMPMEQMPVLEIDGKAYHQSKAICRYFAKKFNLYGANDLEALEIDMNMDDIEDMRVLGTKFFREKDPAAKAILKAEALEKLPFYLGKFEERVKKNGGYFVANQLSYVDIFFATLIDTISYMFEKDLLKDYPTLKKMHDSVLSHPKLKAYIDKRPKFTF